MVLACKLKGRRLLLAELGDVSKGRLQGRQLRWVHATGVHELPRAPTAVGVLVRESACRRGVRFHRLAEPYSLKGAIYSSSVSKRETRRPLVPRVRVCVFVFRAIRPAL